MAIIIAVAIITFVLLSNAFSAWLGLSFFSWLLNVSLVTKGAVFFTAVLISLAQIFILRVVATNKETNQ